MKYLTLKWLQKERACQPVVDWFKSQKDKKDLKSQLKACERDNHLDYFNWMIVRKLSRVDKVRYAVYAAEQVIDIFEKKYPNDARPRKAIQAAKKYIKNPSANNKNAAADAADAAYAAYATADAAYATAKKQMQLKICKYGLKLLEAK